MKKALLRNEVRGSLGKKSGNKDIAAELSSIGDRFSARALLSQRVLLLY
jgi:hypothetical protein